MRKTSKQSLRTWALAPAVLVALVAGVLVSSTRAIDLGASVKKVEEDWELVLNDPDTNVNAPQVTCVISPVNHTDGVYAALELNHGTLPEYTAGGLQLQVWNGEDWLTVRDHADTSLQNSGEVVTWTRRMWLNDGKLTFRVLNGNSTSWGTFGDNENIKLSISSSLSNLNLYSPDVSKANSGVGFGAQRVQSLVLKRVRYYDGSGNLLLEDPTPRVVHQQ